ncbi:hypothetical protein Adu01nite_30350 [Paractinoplanes durhamensis]|uniref:Aminoglycoside phosphotransferase domain-containing protein n=1 Tax=Paractinoplanes durhamensis TaxID=113563 RepID=A0ABQ3YVQ8_9ACTN|nr:hypothetical protein Adu01nite_30350 [Actinoplanes durhamensis]
MVRQFDLGRPVGEPVAVPGGLSNELWRVTTSEGVFAVKRMVVNADHPDFVANVEAAFQIEQRAWQAGVPMPEPVVVPGDDHAPGEAGHRASEAVARSAAVPEAGIAVPESAAAPEFEHGAVGPGAGRALAAIGGSLFRVHRWVDGVSGSGAPVVAAARLLADIHAAGNPRWEPAPDAGWNADRWGADLVELARRVRTGGERMLVVDSHGDLDRKNTLLRADGTLMALDWDAAGPIGAVHEAVSLALDWSDGDPGAFAEAVRAYTLGVPAQPWVFAGWVAAQGEWLDYNATHRAATPLGQAEVAGTLARLRTTAANLESLLAALPGG